MKRISLVTVAFSIFLLAGCVVGPNYKRPLVKVPEQWTVTPARGTSTKPQESDEWWSSFQDPELNSLVQRAVSRNLDLKLALERVQEARAARGIARSDYFPSVDANASATRLRGGINQGVIRAVPSSADPNARPDLISPFETNSFQGNLSALWELDVFGGIRRGVEAATADVTAVEENRRNVLVILFGDIGRGYAQLRGFQRRLEIANKNIHTQQETLDLTSARAKAGLATVLDVSRAAAQLESTRAVVPTLLSGVDVSVHRLSALLGEEPGALRSELEKASPIPAAGPDVEVGLPSDLLRRRPDIRRAEAQLAAATARIEEAKADLFPRFVLTGTAGRQATQLRDLTLGLGNFFSVGPGISLPLFNGGRTRSNMAVQTSRQRGALISYQSAILDALEEVQNALVNYSQEQERRDRLNQAVQQSQLAVDLATEQYRAGLVDFLSVLEAQRQLYANEDQLVQSQTSVTTSVIALYRALGGGWSAAGIVSMNKPSP
ncbi:MAG: efflux transporter outer membrane subunit [Acidobacteria bacterium]|nr:efflux transporter outer membrane subunit [Acidobacteriota bacterium]MCI0723521.1 efflux transporter outer membrane subunit [Acidobacteriota bacterium]